MDQLLLADAHRVLQLASALLLKTMTSPADVAAVDILQGADCPWVAEALNPSNMCKKVPYQNSFPPTDQAIDECICLVCCWLDSFQDGTNQLCCARPCFCRLANEGDCKRLIMAILSHISSASSK